MIPACTHKRSRQKRICGWKKKKDDEEQRQEAAEPVRGLVVVPDQSGGGGRERARVARTETTRENHQLTRARRPPVDAGVGFFSPIGKASETQRYRA